MKLYRHRSNNELSNLQKFEGSKILTFMRRKPSQLQAQKLHDFIRHVVNIQTNPINFQLKTNIEVELKL